MSLTAVRRAADSAKEDKNVVFMVNHLNAGSRRNQKVV